MPMHSGMTEKAMPFSAYPAVPNGPLKLKPTTAATAPYANHLSCARCFPRARRKRRMVEATDPRMIKATMPLSAVRAPTKTSASGPVTPCGFTA